MKQKRILMVLSILIMAAFACNAPTQGQTATPTVDINTAIVQTLTAGAPTQIPQTHTPTQPEATATQAVTDTPAPSSTTAIPTPCNAAMFVSDVTVPDGASIQAGTSFVKTWQFKNVGTCTWNSSYQLIFLSGDAMGAPAATPMTAANILPNGIVNVSVSLTAPAAAGTYQSNFKLRAADGTIFGIGNSANDPFWTKINAVSGNTAVPSNTPVPGNTAVPSSTPVALATSPLKLVTVNPKTLLLLQPDLRVVSIGFSPTTVYSNANMIIFVSIVNSGTLATSGNFTVKFWGTPNDAKPGCAWTTNQAVAPGSGIKFSCNTYSWNQAYSSGVVTRAIVDSENNIAESNEGNNTLQLKVVVK